MKRRKTKLRGTFLHCLILFSCVMNVNMVTPHSVCRAAKWSAHILDPRRPCVRKQLSDFNGLVRLHSCMLNACVEHSLIHSVFFPVLWSQQVLAMKQSSPLNHPDFAAQPMNLCHMHMHLRRPPGEAPL